jgi:hypothetical protein
MPERVGSFGLAAGSERLIAAFESGFAWYDSRGQSVTWLARPQRLKCGSLHLISNTWRALIRRYVMCRPGNRHVGQFVRVFNQSYHFRCGFR